MKRNVSRELPGQLKKNLGRAVLGYANAFGPSRLLRLVRGTDVAVAAENAVASVESPDRRLFPVHRAQSGDGFRVRPRDAHGSRGKLIAYHHPDVGGGNLRWIVRRPAGFHVGGLNIAKLAKGVHILADRLSRKIMVRGWSAQAAAQPITAVDAHLLADSDHRWPADLGESESQPHGHVRPRRLGRHGCAGSAQSIRKWSACFGRDKLAIDPHRFLAVKRLSDTPD